MIKYEVDDTTPCLYALKYCMSVIFARFVCALLSFFARKFPTKSETREPGEIIVECTSYIYICLPSNSIFDFLTHILATLWTFL